VIRLRFFSLAFAGIVIFVTALTCMAQSSSPYTFEVIARTGGGEFNFTSIGQYVSINDSGNVGFIGQFDGKALNGNTIRTENLFLYEGQTGTTKKMMIDAFQLKVLNTLPISEVGQFFYHGLQLNNQNQILARRVMNAEVRLTLLNPPLFGPFSYLETWQDGQSQGLPTLYAMGDAGISPASGLLFWVNPVTGATFPSAFIPGTPIQAVYGWPSFNNKLTGMVFTGLRRGENCLISVNTPPYSYNFLKLNLAADYSDLPHPVVADNASIVAQISTSSGHSIQLLSYDLATSTIIADPAKGFTNVGFVPGISDDGTIIAFSGELAGNAPVEGDLTPGRGVFVATKTITGWSIKRIAGIRGNGFLDPGESYEDINKNGKFDPQAGEMDEGEISEFAYNERIAVSNSGQVLFKANGIDGNVGVYSSGISAGSSPTLVVKKGEPIAGLGAAQNFTIYDSITNGSNPQFAFWVDLGGGSSAVVRSVPCSASSLTQFSLALNQPPLCPIRTVEFEALDGTALEKNSSFATGGGLRIFPDKLFPTDTIDRSRVRVKAAGFVPNSIIYFKSFDVDDPSDIDAGNTQGNDNNGSPKSGIISKKGENGVTNVVSITTDNDGKADVDFAVTLQPGDNFVVAVSHSLPVLDGLTVEGLSLKDGSGKILPTEQASVTSLITVWKKLYIYTDSMTPVSGNSVKSRIKQAQPFPLVSGVTDLTVDFLPQDSGFENGSIIIPALNQNQAIRVNSSEQSSDGSFHVYVDQIILPNAIPSQGLGFVLFDDDNVNERNILPDGDEGQSVPLPDLLLMQEDDNPSKNLFARAYIQPKHILSHDGAPFLLNSYTDSLFLLPATYGPQSIYSTARVSDYWAVYILGAYQTAPQADNDPKKEFTTLGIVDALGGIGANVFNEVISQHESTVDASHSRYITAVHEIGHLLGLPHEDLGIMSPGDVRTGQAKDLVFSDKSLARLRRYKP
jgi:hypothetical protein